MKLYLSLTLLSLYLLSFTVNNNQNNNCPLDMKYVSGQMISADSDYIEWLQNQSCSEWIDKNYPARCKVFNRLSWLKDSAKLPRKKINFCIDTFEFPNQVGSKPEVSITWIDAKQICESLNKRLCNEEEWTFACEGEEAMPYPYGYIRDAESCNIDKPWREISFPLLLSKDKAMSELDRLWQGNNSGEMNKCISPFGVYDMTGNVDEWTSSTKKSGYPSILKGGYWSVVRNRCRSSTRSHNQWHKFYQQGFRCCKNSN